MFYSIAVVVLVALTLLYSTCLNLRMDWKLCLVAAILFWLAASLPALVFTMLGATGFWLKTTVCSAVLLAVASIWFGWEAIDK